MHRIGEGAGRVAGGRRSRRTGRVRRVAVQL